MLKRNPADQGPEVDALTGTTTTGHEWDGIRELNTPLPRWWLWLFYATILWAVGYWIVYPSWPLVSSYTKGAFRWQSRDAVVSDLDALKAQRGPMVEKLRSASLQEIASIPTLLDFARARLARLSRRIARLATVRVAAAGEAIRTSTMMNGFGAAISTRSRRPSVTASAPETPMIGRARPCRLSGATAFSSVPMSRTSATSCLARRRRPRSQGRSHGRQEDLFRQLRGLPRRDRQGQTRARRAEPERCHLALRGGQASGRRRHLERSRRSDARLGGAARRRHDQGARGLRAFARRRREMSHAVQS